MAGVLTTSVLSFVAVLTGATTASADTAPVAPVTTPTVSADVLPTVQINGVVYDQVIVGNTVYATGSFTSARPAGSAAGSNETARSNILAYSLTTGVLSTTWAPSLNGIGRSIKASADGSIIYVGGQFTTVNGTTRNRVAALNATTGALITTFNPNASARVDTLVVSGSTLYMGGIFSTIGGQARANIGAVNATTGAALAWNPGSDAEVLSMTVPPGSNEVVASGRMVTLAGASVFGMGAIDGTTGAALPWAITNTVQDYGTGAAIYSVSSDATHVFGTGYNYFGSGNFEGTFSATVNGGNEIYVSGCFGDTYDATPVGNVLYSVGHRHNCSAIGGNPETSPRSYQHAQAQTTDAASSGLVNQGGNFNGHPAPQLLHWQPTLAYGTYTGLSQAAWTVEGNSSYVVLGGEFPSINGTAQQGLARFAISSIAPNKEGPQGVQQLTPTVMTQVPGRVRVTWQSAWDRDNALLKYELLRGASAATATVISTQTLSTDWWNRPNMGFQDTTAAAGSSQTYRVRVTDPFGNTITGSPTTVTVPTGTGTTSTYATTVLNDGASHLWRLGEASGTSGYDYAAFDDLTVDSSATRGADGAMTNDATAKSTTFSGTATVPATTSSTPVAGTNSFSEEAWFKTTSTTGGKIVGFGNSSTGDSNGYDRHIYMTGSGQLVFGVYPNQIKTITSPKSYNDGQWHQVVANLGSGGMELFVDGVRVARDAGTTSGQAYSGYWRVGGDNLNAWPGDWSSSKFTGSIEDVAIYPAPLTLTQVQSHYTASGRTLNLPARPTDAYGAAVWDAQPTFYWRLDDAANATAPIDRMTNQANGVYASQVVKGEAGAPANSAGTSIRLTGTADQAVVASTAVNNPTVYTLETWFKTNSTSGGRIIGFGNSNDPNGRSNNYDRYIWMLANGTLSFGTYNGNTNVASSSASYNDGNWHLVTASQDSTGMKLYVDGTLVGTNPTTDAQNYTGYWRLGTDNTWGGANTDDLAGSLDEAAVYDTALSASTVSQHWQLGKPATANQAPVAAFSATPANLTAKFDASASTDPDGTVASYSWQFGDGSTGTGVSPSHTYASANTYSVVLTVTDNNGATNTITKQVTVTNPANQLPTASFSVTTSKLKASFDGTASSDPDGTIASYNWDFGDGSTGTGATPAHTYTGTGPYKVALTVVDNSGGSSPTVTKSVSLTANVKPTAAFSNTCTNLNCSFDGTTSSDTDGTIASYSWDFGDGGSSTAAKPSHSYASGNTYTVKLTVTDNDGATDTFSSPVTVQAANVSPTAAFTSTCTNLSCSFDGTTSTDPDGSIASYAWDFGDGSTSTSATQNHSFAKAGQYQVTLTVTDNRGGTGTLSKLVTVTAPNQAPTAAFTSNCSQLNCSFDATSSADPDGSIVSYAWNFGDNSAAGSGITTSHTYTQGTYTVTLKVTDDQGASTSITHQVSPAPAANQAPVASFTKSCTNLACTFDATGSTDPDGSVVTYAWDFGDAQTGSGATTAHSFGSANTYQVKLTVTDNQGATNAVTQAVTVTAAPGNQNPTASFSATPANLAVAFDGSASSDPDGTITSYAWTFGDGTSATGKTVNHTYALAGQYSVVLTVTDNQGGTGSLTRTVTVQAAAGQSVAADTFTRTVASGWGTADTGGAWTYSGSKSTPSTDGSTGKINIPAGQTAYQRLNGVSNLNTDVLVTTWTDAMVTGGGAFLGTIVRSTAAGDYFAQVKVLASGAVTLNMSKTGGAIGSTVTVPGLTYSAGTKLNIRVQAIGSGPTTLRAKVWAVGTTEPASWQVSTTDSTAGMQVAGGVGFMPYNSGSATASLMVRYDNLAVTTAQ